MIKTLLDSGMTCKDSAAKTGLSPRTLRAIYNGVDPRLSTVEALLRATGHRLEIVPLKL